MLISGDLKKWKTSIFEYLNVFSLIDTYCIEVTFDLQ